MGDCEKATDAETNIWIGSVQVLRDPFAGRRDYNCEMHRSRMPIPSKLNLLQALFAWPTQSLEEDFDVA